MTPDDGTTTDDRTTTDDEIPGTDPDGERTAADERPVAPTELVSLAELEGSPHAQAFEGEPLTIRLSLAAGESVPPHQHPDRRIVLYLLEGRLSVTLGDDEHEVGEGEAVRFDGNQDVSPEALEDSTALLVLAKRAE